MKRNLKFGLFGAIKAIFEFPLLSWAIGKKNPRGENELPLYLGSELEFQKLTW